MHTLTHEERIAIHKRERARHERIAPSEDRRAAEMARYAADAYSDEDAAMLFQSVSDSHNVYPYGPPWNQETQKALAARGNPPSIIGSPLLHALKEQRATCMERGDTYNLSRVEAEIAAFEDGGRR